MNHFAAYHNPEKMEYGALDVRLAQYTNQRIADPTLYIGHRCWTFTGEKVAGSRHKRYFLRDTFVIQDILPSDNPEWDHVLWGNDVESSQCPFATAHDNSCESTAARRGPGAHNA